MLKSERGIACPKTKLWYLDTWNHCFVTLPPPPPPPTINEPNSKVIHISAKLNENHSDRPTVHTARGTVSPLSPSPGILTPISTCWERARCPTGLTTQRWWTWKVVISGRGQSLCVPAPLCNRPHVFHSPSAMLAFNPKLGTGTQWDRDIMGLDTVELGHHATGI